MNCNGKVYTIFLNDKTYHCPVEVALDLIGGKWKGIIIWYLKEGTKRFSELKRLIPSISQKVLTRELRDLEKSGLVDRKVYPEVPPRVEYTLSEYGETLVPIIDDICKWGVKHILKFGDLKEERAAG